MGASGASPLEVLAQKAGREFPHLFTARKRTASGLADRSQRLQGLSHSPDASVVLMGSWGRAEVTAGSDDDFMLLVHGVERDAVEPSMAAIGSVLDSSPGTQGIFGVPVFSGRLVHDIGLDQDDNSNLTRRMLFLLESAPVTGAEAYRAVREEILDRYVDDSVKAYRPPRFLLNDVVRYWRTLCVDFAGKEHEARRSGDCETPSCAPRARSSLPVACSPPWNAFDLTWARFATTWKASSIWFRPTASRSVSSSTMPSNREQGRSAPTTSSLGE